jgi:hypothetical protein
MLNSLPSTFAEAEEAMIVDEMDGWFRRIDGQVRDTTASSRARFEEVILGHLLVGEIDHIDTAISLASELPAADAALRRYARTYGSAGRWSELPIEVQGWALAALERPPLSSYPRRVGGALDNLIRDIAIRLMVDAAALRWSLAHTRKDSTEKPSAAYFVALVLQRRGFKIAESTVNDTYWGRHGVADRLAAGVISVLK